MPHMLSHALMALPTGLAMAACAILSLLSVSPNGPILPSTPDEVADTARHLAVDIEHPAYASAHRYSKSETMCAAANPDIASPIIQAFERGDTKHKAVSADLFVTGRPENVDICHTRLLDEPTPASQRAVAMWIAQSHHLEVQAILAPTYFDPRWSPGRSLRMKADRDSHVFFQAHLTQGVPPCVQ
jgi:hypothetical protein